MLSGPIIASIQPGYGQPQTSFLGHNNAPAQSISATQRPATANLFNSFQGNPASELSSAVGNLQHLALAPSPVHYVNQASQGSIQQSAPHMQSYTNQNSIGKFQPRHIGIGRTEKPTVMMPYYEKKSQMEHKVGSYLSLHADAKPFNPAKRPGFEQPAYLTGSAVGTTTSSVPEPMGMPASSAGMMTLSAYPTQDDPFRKPHKDADVFMKQPSVRQGSLHFLDDKGPTAASQFDAMVKGEGMPPPRPDFPSSGTAFSSYSPVSSSVFQSKSSAFSEPVSSPYSSGIHSSSAVMPIPITTNPKVEPHLTFSQTSMSSHPNIPLPVESEMRSMSPSKQADLQQLPSRSSSSPSASNTDKRPEEPALKEGNDHHHSRGGDTRGSRDHGPYTNRKEDNLKISHSQPHGMPLPSLPDHQMNKRPKSLPSSNHGNRMNPNNQPPLGSFRVRPGGAQFPRHMMGPQPPMMNHPHPLGPMMRFSAPGGGLNTQTMRYRAPPHLLQQQQQQQQIPPPPTSSSAPPPSQHPGVKSNKVGGSGGRGGGHNQEQPKQNDNFKKPPTNVSRNGAPSKLVFPNRVRKKNTLSLKLFCRLNYHQY